MQQRGSKCSNWVQFQKRQNGLCSFPRQTIQHHSNPSLCPNTNAEKAEVDGSMMTYKTIELTPERDVILITGDWNAKVGSQEIPGVTCKLGLGEQNEAGQRLIESFLGEYSGHIK